MLERQVQVNATTRFIARSLSGMAELFRNCRILAVEHGQWRSIRERKATDAVGEPIPWYTYPAIEYLRSFVFEERDVFEFGAGNSSLFWARRSRSVISVEDDLKWFQHIDSRGKGNQVVIHRSQEEDYVRCLSEQGRCFDIIVIDGKWRMKCAVEAVKYLERGGMIVLDNSDRIEEMSVGAFLRGQGFLQIDFSGFGPINGYCWTTSIFMSMPTTLQQNFIGPAPIGGLRDSVG